MKKELKRLDKSIQISSSKKSKSRKSFSKKYSITSVKQSSNQIIINFNKKISKKDIRYSIKRGKGKYQYIFDIKGRFKDARPTKLSLNNIDRVRIIQYKFNTLRIILTNR